MNIFGIFGSAVIRKIAYILTGVALWALLSLFGIGNARAQSGTPASNINQDSTKIGFSREQAYNSCIQHSLIERNYYPEVSCSLNASNNGSDADTYNCNRHNILGGPVSGTCAYGGAMAYHSWGFPQCPTNRLWNDTTKTCALACPNGYKEDPLNPGTCLDGDKCLALNPAFKPELTRQLTHVKSASTLSFCNATGCALGRQYGGNTVCTGNDMCVTTGNWVYTGQSCSSISGEPGFSPPPPQGITEPGNKPQECVPSGGGLTMCSKPNGQLCYMTASGTATQNCWASGETGTKHSDNNSQKRDAGPNKILPDLNLPNGDTLIEKPPTVVTTSTTNFTDASTNKTTTTSTTNFITLNGTNTAPNGGKGTGEPSNGTGGGAAGGSGTEPEGQPGSTGGGTCDSAPATTGDPVGAMLATQLWKARCALEKNNPTNETGNIANCKGPWNVTGTDQQINKARALRESLCPGMPADADFLGNGEGEPTTGEVRENGTDLLPGGLDKSGFGFGNSCPTIPAVSVMGQTIDFNTGPFCDWMSLGGWFVVLFAGLASLRLLTEA